MSTGANLVPPRAQHHRNAAVRAVTSNLSARVGSLLILPVAWLLISAAVSRIPGPLPVAQSLIEEARDGQLFSQFVISIERFGIGMAVAVVVGVVIGVAIGLWRTLDLLLTGPIVAALAVPSVIWALLSVMWFGFGNMGPIATVVLSATPFVSVNVATGIQAISQELARMSRAFKVSGILRVRHLLMPAVAGYLFAGTRLALIVGWQALLLSEWFGAADGVGFRARYWYDANRLEGTLAWVVLFIVFVLVVDRVLLERASRWVFRWRIDKRSTVTVSEES